MDLLPAIVFSVAIIPLFYVAVGLLSVSRFVNASVTDLSQNTDQEFLAGTASGVDGAKRAGGVFLAMTAMLAGVALVAWWSQDLVRTIMLAFTFFLTWFLFAGQTNPTQSTRRVVLGLLVAGWLLATKIWWPTSWVWNGISSFLVVTGMMLSFRTIQLRLLAILSAGLFVYDVVHVYGTGLMMLAAENSGDAASSLMVAIPSSASAGAEAAYHVGMGDIGFPGAWMMLAFRMASAHDRPAVVVTTLVGIVLGWGATIATLQITEHPVPALIFLVPGCALGYLASAVPLRLNEKQVPANA